MSTRATLPALLLLAGLAACGGGGSTGPNPVPSPTPAGNTVVAEVFYDENANGQLDGGESIRIPDVEVAIGGRTARSAKLTGRAEVTGVAPGAQGVALRGETLPPFFTAGAPKTVDVPQTGGSTVAVPVTIALGGSTEPNVYMAFGDSITRGDGSDAGGYPRMLQALLGNHFGVVTVSNRGADSTNSFEAVERIRRNLVGSRPAFTLVLYGTNDWHAPQCQESAAAPGCPTIANLREVLDEVKGFGSRPFLATIPPVNPALNPEGRNRWVAESNERIRALAQQEGAFLVDLEKAFLAQSNLAGLFSDHVHPNDAGYRVMAEAFFEAIAHGRSSP